MYVISGRSSWALCRGRLRSSDNEEGIDGQALDRAAGDGCLGHARSAGVGTGRHRGHHRTAERTADRNRGFQAGTCYSTRYADLHDRILPDDARFLHSRPAGTRRSGSPSTSSSTAPSYRVPLNRRLDRIGRAALRRPHDQNPARRPAAGPDRQPAGDAELLHTSEFRNHGRNRNRANFVPVPDCPKARSSGDEEVTLVVNTANAVPTPAPAPGNFLPVGFVIPPDPAKGTKVAVYNLEPKPGEPARFGFVIAFSKVVFLETEVAWENDFHESFTIKLPRAVGRRVLDPDKPPGELRPDAGDQEGRSRQRHLHHQADHLLRPERSGYEHLYSTWFRAESYGRTEPDLPGRLDRRSRRSCRPGAQHDGLRRTSRSTRRSRSTRAPTQVDSPAAATVTTKLPFDPAKEGGAVEGTEGICSRTCAKRKSRCRQAWA